MHPARARKQLVAPYATSPGGSKTAPAGSPRKRDRAAADPEAGSPPAPFKLVSPRLLEDKPLRSETSTCVIDCRFPDGHRGLCLTSDGPAPPSIKAVWKVAKAGKAPGVAKSPGAPPEKLHFDIEPASPTRTGPA